jgi:hypothetical protein
MSEADAEAMHGVWSDLGAATKRPPQWVVEGILPAGITFLAGPPKSMKSTVEMALALTVAGVQHTALPEDLRRCPDTGHVLIWSAEATAGELKQMVEDGFGCQVPDNGTIMVADEPFQWRLDDPGAVSKMLEWLEYFQPRLFCIDPLRDFHDFDERDSGPMNRLLRPIQRWAKEHGSALLVVHHARKLASGEEDRNLTAGDLRGTSALFGLADGVIVLTPKGRAGIHFNVVVKRGQPWERTIKLGAWGGGDEAEQRATERIDAVVADVYKALAAAPDHPDLSAFTKGRIINATAALKRLGAIDSDGRPTRDGQAKVNAAQVTWSPETGVK